MKPWAEAHPMIMFYLNKDQVMLANQKEKKKKEIPTTKYISASKRETMCIVYLFMLAQGTDMENIGEIFTVMAVSIMATKKLT